MANCRINIDNPSPPLHSFSLFLPLPNLLLPSLIPLLLPCLHWSFLFFSFLFFSFPFLSFPFLCVCLCFLFLLSLISSTFPFSHLCHLPPCLSLASLLDLYLLSTLPFLRFNILFIFRFIILFLVTATIRFKCFNAHKTHQLFPAAAPSVLAPVSLRLLLLNTWSALIGRQTQA